MGGKKRTKREAENEPSDYEEEEEAFKTKKELKVPKKWTKKQKRKRKDEDEVPETSEGSDSDGSEPSDDEESEDDTEKKEEKKNKAKIREKKKAKEKDPTRKKKKKKSTSQYRVTLPDIQQFKHGLDDEVLEELRSGPFGKLFEAFHEGLIKTEEAGKSMRMLSLMLQAYDPERDTFIVGDKTFRISSKDISKILGLPRKGVMFGGRTKDLKMVESLFGKLNNKNRVTKKTVLTVFKKVMMQKPKNEEERRNKKMNVARIVILELCIKFLFPNAGGMLAWKRMKAIWGDVREYAWAVEVKKFLAQSLTLQKTSVSNSKNSGGCVYLMLYWLCEKTHVLQPIKERENEKHLMRKWNLSELMTKVDKYDFNRFKNLFRNLKSDPEDTESDSEEEIEEERGQLSGEDEIRRLKQENERLRTENKDLKEEMRKIKADYEAREKLLLDKLDDANADLVVENIGKDSARRDEDLINKELKKLQDMAGAGPMKKLVSSNANGDDEDNGNERTRSICRPNLAPRKKKLLVFDLNGLLVHRVYCPNNGDIPSNRIPDGKCGSHQVYGRPFVEEFMLFCLERFEVGIWSSAQWKNVDGVLNCVIKKLRSRFKFVWDQGQCTDSGYKSLDNKERPIFLKELEKIWDHFRGEFSASDTLLIDDQPYKALLNPAHTAIFPDEYKIDQVDDKALGPDGELRLYLEGLADADDVTTYVEENPFGKPRITTTHSDWEFYSKIIEDMKQRH